jgi:hypothetical protein
VVAAWVLWTTINYAGRNERASNALTTAGPGRQQLVENKAAVKD